MRLSRTAEIAEAMIQEVLTMTQKGRSDAAEEHYPTDVFPWAISGQIETKLKDVAILMTEIIEDAHFLEKRMSANKAPDEYGRDEETGKKIGRLYLAE